MVLCFRSGKAVLYMIEIRFARAETQNFHPLRIFSGKGIRADFFIREGYTGYHRVQGSVYRVSSCSWEGIRVIVMFARIFELFGVCADFHGKLTVFQPLFDEK